MSYEYVDICCYGYGYGYDYGYCYVFCLVVVVIGILVGNVELCWSDLCIEVMDCLIEECLICDVFGC